MAFRATGFNVEGTVKPHNGTAVMTLACLNGPDIKITMPRPSTKEVLDRIETGTMVAHPTRQPLQKKDVTTMMGTIQRQLRLQPGGDGGWNEEAQRRLENLLANPKRTGKQLALEDKKSEGKMPASESSSSDSSSSDSGSSSEEAPQAASMELEVSKLQGQAG